VRFLPWFLLACGPQGTPPPPDGWANTAPTVVEQVLDQGEHQLLAVRQGDDRAWVVIPDIAAAVDDHVLLGAGTPRRDVRIPELGREVALVVDIDHAQVVDADTARAVLAARAPEDAVTIGALYATLAARDGQQVVIHGTVAKVAHAVGWSWVHVRDGTGDAAEGTHDLTVKTRATVHEGQRVTFRGTLRVDVDLGFGYHYDALVEDGPRIP
jgi:hypothetical protein